MQCCNHITLFAAYVSPQTLKPIADLPQWAQAAFGNYRTLNRIQSRLHETALHSDENILLCAPTVSSQHTGIQHCFQYA